MTQQKTPGPSWLGIAGGMLIALILILLALQGGPR